MKRKASGFTLIEIVLVLALAGLLLVIVFLAVSGANRSRRDAIRKRDAGRLVAAMEAYRGDNLGKQPESQVQLDAAVAKYFSNNADPGKGTPYDIEWMSNGAPHDFTLQAGEMAFVRAHQCNHTGTAGPIEDPPNFSLSGNVFAVAAGLEQGSICFDNGHID